MTFAAPWFLLAGALAALAILALHFLAREEPRRYLLPTARFVPESREQAPSRSRRLRDLLILALRLLALAAIALAFARPSLTVAKAALIQVVVADHGPGLRDTAELRREVERVARSGDVVVPLDSGGLSAGLVHAIREARRLRDRADSIAIVLVTPLTRASFDSATLAIRAGWSGGLDWHPVRAASDSSASFPLTLRATEEDPLRATLNLSGLGETRAAQVRLIRETAITAADSAWAREPDHVVVRWPAEFMVTGDSIGAVVTTRTVLVAPFARPAGTPRGRPVAWWSDGRVAAAETITGGGCIREVAIPVDPAGDLALRERLRDLTRDLLSPCGGPHDLRLADSAVRAALIGSASPAVATATLPARPDAGRVLPPWLLGAGIVLLIAEHALRRRSGSA